MSRTPAATIRGMEKRDGRTSAWTGHENLPELVPQHRQGGMGGRKDKHRLSNVVWLESLINGLIESDPEWQAEAKRRGVKVSLNGNPAEVPILYPDGVWYLLCDHGHRHKQLPDGGFEECPDMTSL